MSSHYKGQKTFEKESVSLLFSELQIDDSNCEWSEKPDCRYTTLSGDMIGIEVTCCIDANNGVLKMQQEFEKACKESEVMLRNAGYSNMNINVVYNYALQRSPIKDSDFRKTVTEEIERHIRCDSLRKKDKILHKQLKMLGAFRYKYVDTLLVYPGQIGQLTVNYTDIYDIIDISQEAVINSIQKKEDKLNEYLSMPENHTIKEYWLVLTIPEKTYAQIGDLMPIDISSKYSRIYITDAYQNCRLK